MANEPNLDKTPDELAMLENVVCDFLEMHHAGTRNPYDRRLDPAAKMECVRQLGIRLGVRYARCTLGNFQLYDQRQKPVLDRLRVFAERMPEHLAKSGGLILYGDPGTGKDHLLAALLKIAAAKHALDVAWYDGGALYDDFYFAIKSESDQPLKELLMRLRTPHVLAISDPQPPQGPLSDAQIRRLRDVIDRRYRLGLSTWITTNLDRTDDAADLLTTPVLQRIKEGSGMILCDWEPHRERVKAGW